MLQGPLLLLPGLSVPAAAQATQAAKGCRWQRAADQPPGHPEPVLAVARPKPLGKGRPLTPIEAFKALILHDSSVKPPIQLRFIESEAT